ncbi:hypothetical protein F5972_08680 [Microbispora cellulosiformans]|uniref:Uncharacterized protein n=1 Tax=Microbispora cellulosiformans TaxID=2614688 RepID=A0A5J5K5A9_9ACTN|nr:hypothetical protein [Microbispora cellulosiformans]KAA9379716.1 hypothetical protein F5972_08680 [Microbispora cellulosiformans]
MTERRHTHGTTRPRSQGEQLTHMIDALRDELTARGFTVNQRRTRTYVLLEVRQSLVPTAADYQHDLDGFANFAGLTQDVVFSTDPERPGSYAWHLLWGEGLRGEGEPSLQRICPAEDTGHAVRVLEQMLRLLPEQAPASTS